MTEGLAEIASRLTMDDLPREVVHAAKLRILDAVGLAFGNSSLPSAARALRALSPVSTGGVCHTFGHLDRLTSADAALVTGLSISLTDYDDTYGPGNVHASAPIVAATLAVGEERRVAPADILLSVAIGLEVICRLGEAAPHAFTRRSLHATSYCGAPASALACGRSLGLEPRRLSSSMGIAASQSSGLLQALQEGVPVKALHAGWAAHSGIVAAFLAEQGFEGTRYSLEGRQGFYAAFLRDEVVDLSSVLEGFGTDWRMLKIITKPYPCCHFIHPFLEAAIAYHDREDGAGSEVVAVEASVPREAVVVVCEPRELKIRPHSEYAAKFSLPFCVAAALVDGHFDEHSLNVARLDDERFRRVAELVTYQVDKDPNLAQHYGGALTVRDADGMAWHLRVEDPIGSQSRPLGQPAIVAKFCRNVASVLTPTERRLVEMRILNFENLPSVANLFDELACEKVT